MDELLFVDAENNARKLGSRYNNMKPPPPPQQGKMRHMFPPEIGIGLPLAPPPP
ncbi:hypothetical protein JCGZ_09297 [Jatropha curcas]|uniref:Uncharacterized protein n=1 Tax=Jatropha curcas TaxID=180498 RepID=A0A067KT38_JATCU|nr:hypothetical protein JCGZ_09297 [Jatropha curcas]